MTEEFGIDLIGIMQSETSFDIEEAVSLIHQEVVRIQDRAYLPIPPSAKAGLIVGVIDLNNEVEVLIKFEKGVLQLTKSELKEGFLFAE